MQSLNQRPRRPGYFAADGAELIVIETVEGHLQIMKCMPKQRMDAKRLATWQHLSCFDTKFPSFSTEILRIVKIMR